MACMEHWCVKCGWFECNNIARMGDCPKCGSRVLSSFDEPDHVYRDSDDYEAYGEEDE